MEAKMSLWIPGGNLILTHMDGKVTRAFFPETVKYAALKHYLNTLPVSHIDWWAREIEAYFLGRPVTFTIPIKLPQMTEFTTQVLNKTAEIRWGQIRSYGHIAKALNRPGGARAVGQALGSNPIPLLIPCHRVIKSDGTLGGFTGGIKWKRLLLGLEKVHFKEG